VQSFKRPGGHQPPGQRMRPRDDPHLARQHRTKMLQSVAIFPGIGKTRLVEEACALAGPGARVLIGESAPLAGAALAFGPFVAALSDHAGWLIAEDGPGDLLTQRHRLFERVLRLLADLASGAPLLLVLEDLHWADESSRELLAFLAVRAARAGGQGAGGVPGPGRAARGGSAAAAGRGAGPAGAARACGCRA
jgi:hypothetical protein